MVLGMAGSSRGGNRKSQKLSSFEINDKKASACYKACYSRVVMVREKHLGPVVQNIFSLTSSLRGQFIKCFTTLQPKTLKYFVEKMREAFALQKLFTFFNKKYWRILDIIV